MKKPKTVNILFCQGVEGKSVYINDTRVAGSKPWGGGKTLAEFNPSLADIRSALSDKPPTKAQLWRRVARLAGELLLIRPDSKMDGSLSTIATDAKDRQQFVEFLIQYLRSEIDGCQLQSKIAKKLAKLEAALEAYEECKE